MNKKRNRMWSGWTYIRRLSEGRLDLVTSVVVLKYIKCLYLAILTSAIMGCFNSNGKFPTGTGEQGTTAVGGNIEERIDADTAGPGSNACKEGIESSVNTVLYGFNKDTEGFAVRYSDPEDLMQSSRLTWDSKKGDPNRGSLKVTVPFSDAEQKVQVSVTNEPADWSERILRVRVCLESGLSKDIHNPGGAKLYGKSGVDYVGSYGEWVNLSSNQWIEVKFDPKNSNNFVDASMSTRFDEKEIVETGVEFATGKYGTYNDSTIYVDTFTIE